MNILPEMQQELHTLGNIIESMAQDIHDRYGVPMGDMTFSFAEVEAEERINNTLEDFDQLLQGATTKFLHSVTQARDILVGDITDIGEGIEGSNLDGDLLMAMVDLRSSQLSAEFKGMFEL